MPVEGQLDVEPASPLQLLRKQEFKKGIKTRV